MCAFCIVVPGPPQSLEASLINDTSVLLKWNPPSSIKGDIVEYQVFLSGYSQSTSVSL